MAQRLRDVGPAGQHPGRLLGKDLDPCLVPVVADAQVARHADGAQDVLDPQRKSAK